MLKAIYHSYNREKRTMLSPPVKEIYLTLEIFSGTADITVDIISRLEKTVEYWRKFIPKDGENLMKL